MKKYNKKQIIISLTIIVVLIAGLTYALITMSSPKTEKSCGHHNGKEYCTDRYVGLTQQEAGKLAKSDGLTTKLRQIDDNTSPNNTDLGGTPIYLTIKNGIVTKAELK